MSKHPELATVEEWDVGDYIGDSQKLVYIIGEAAYQEQEKVPS